MYPSLKSSLHLQVLGTPSQEDILGMNPNYNEFRFPQIKSHPWSEVLTDAVDPDAVDLVSSLLKYSPTKRLSCLDAMGHPFFEEILRPGCVLPSGVFPHELALFVMRCRIVSFSTEVLSKVFCWPCFRCLCAERSGGTHLASHFFKVEVFEASLHERSIALTT
jgi:serine/threonine protein kinase